MTKHVLRWAAPLIAGFLVGYTTPHGLTQRTGSSPFSLSVVPSWSNEEPFGRGIVMATDTNNHFYVILTNISRESQSAFEAWNSWGYYAISFEIQTADGRKFTISKKLTDFTRNFPSTFLIPPGESMVYPIRLDDEWKAVPTLPIADETPIPISVTAIYRLDPTRESAQQKVWVGRLESRKYNMNLRHWIPRHSPDPS